MESLETRQQLHQKIDQLLPDQLNQLAEFLAFLEFKGGQSTAPEAPTERRPNLHPGAFVISDNFDEPLPDSFWLGEE